MTTWWPAAPTASTRISDGMPSGGPASVRAWPLRAAASASAGGRSGPGGAVAAAGARRRTRPARPGRAVGDPPAGAEPRDGGRPGRPRPGAGYPFLVDDRAPLARALPRGQVEPADERRAQGADQEHRR